MASHSNRYHTHFSIAYEIRKSAQTLLSGGTSKNTIGYIKIEMTLFQIWFIDVSYKEWESAYIIQDWLMS